MSWDRVLLLWSAAWGAVAVIGFGMSLAGVTRAQRTVRLIGRIDRVRAPRDGGSRKGGISVVVVYRDPETGQDVTITNDGDRGEAITVAWPGREIGVSYLRGRPHAYRFTDASAKAGRGLAWPTFALFLVYAGLVTFAALKWGWPWAPIGFIGLWALIAIAGAPAAGRAKRERLARRATMETVPGQIVAVLKDVSVDSDDGSVSTVITPVLAFSTRQGIDVLAHCPKHVPDPATSHGREVLVHHTPGDPAEFTLG